LRRWTRRYASQRDEFYHAKQIRGILPPGIATLVEELTAKSAPESAGQDARLYGRQDACRYGKQVQLP
jgi:hypothetical protein